MATALFVCRDGREKQRESERVGNNGEERVLFGFFPTFNFTGLQKGCTKCRQGHGNNMYSRNDWALGKSLTVKEMDGWCLSPLPTCQGSQSSHSVWSQGSDIWKYPDETTHVKAGSQKGCPRDGHRCSHLYCHPSCSTMV